MNKVIRFKAKIGYCYLYPDKIILCRTGDPDKIDFENE